MESLYRRKSVRRYDSRPVPQEVKCQLLEAAAQSMDYALSGESEEMQFLDFENYLRTKIKYERKRR